MTGTEQKRNNGSTHSLFIWLLDTCNTARFLSTCLSPEPPMPSSMLLQTLGKRRHVDMARSTPTESRPSWTSPTINGITLTSTGTMSTEWTHCKPRPLGSKVLAANWQPRAGRESSDLRTSHGHGSCISGHYVNVWAMHGKPTQVAHHLENVSSSEASSVVWSTISWWYGYNYGELLLPRRHGLTGDSAQEVLVRTCRRIRSCNNAIMELLYHTNPQAKAWKSTSCWEHIVLLPDVGLIKLARRLHTPRFWEESFSPTVESSSSRSKIATVLCPTQSSAR